MIRVFIADDHDIIRKGLAGIVMGCAGFSVAGEAADGEEALGNIQALRPDIVLLDITMPKLNGLDALVRITACAPQVKVIIISVHKAEPYISRALQAGARGYLLKDNAAEELLLALTRVAGGEVYIGRGICDIIAERIAGHAVGQEHAKDLTSREKDVLRLVAEGKTAKEIAVLLRISPRTVENNKNNLLKKFGLNRTVDLIKYALENKIVD